MATKCSFCTGLVKEGRGKMFVRNDNRVFTFCIPKCESSFRRGWDAKKTRWTVKFHDLKTTAKK